MTFQRLLALLMLPFAITGFSLGQSQTRPAISVEQRIDAATRFVGYFQRTHTPEDLESVINTISEVNSNRESGAPLEPYGETRERQIKNTLSTWFLIFRTIDSVSTNVPAGNRCYFNLAPPGGFIGMDPKEVTGAAERENYERQLADNDARCELQNFQLLELPRLDVDAQLAFRQALRGLIAAEGVGLGSDFAVALATSDLNGARSRLMWAIFDHATDADWQPAALSTSRHVSPSFSETADSKNADKHTAEWLRSSEPRSVAWAAYYAVRDDRKNSIPELLAYIHRHAYDPLFEANVNRRMTLGPEVDDALDAMRAVLVALIKLRATVPSEDLLQLAAVPPDEALILASSPVPQESMLMNAYMSGGFKPRAYGEFYSLAGAQPADSADALRWTVAGNLLANRGSAKFARIIFDRFVLRLDFTVADKSTLFMGGGPIQFPSFEGRERGADWPPIGHYGLSTESPQLTADFKGAETGTRSTDIESTSVLAEGTPSIFLVRYIDRKYGITRLFRPVGQVDAHWLEKLGLGEYGGCVGYDIWNPGSVSPPNAKGCNQYFHFYRVFTVASNQQYDSELRTWLQDQREVYAKIVRGILTRNLITMASSRRPLRIKLVGYDARVGMSATDKKTALSKPPFPDVTPAQTQIQWEDRYAR